MKPSFKTVVALVLALVTFGSVAAQNPSNPKNNKKMKAIELNNAAFKSQIFDYSENAKEWKYKGDKPAIIDFFATWCGPCKMMAPVMDTLAQEYEGKVDVFKVDVDKEEELAALFGVRSIPTFVFIPKEGSPKLMTGGMGIDQMRRLIDENLLK